MVGLFRHDPAQRTRARIVAGMARGRTLDVACGDGYIASLIRDRGCDVAACDISRKRVNTAKRIFGIEAQVADIRALPYPDGTFDTVIAGEILEHLNPISEAFAEIERVCAEGGQILITLPIGTVFGIDRTHQWYVEPIAVSSMGGRCELLQNRYMFLILRLQKWKYSEWRKQKTVGEGNARTEQDGCAP